MLRLVPALVLAGVLPVALPAGDSENRGMTAKGDETSRYFASPGDAVLETAILLQKEDWPELARCYDLSLTPQVARSQLRDGTFFLNSTISRTGPNALSRWREPFGPGAVMEEAKAVGDPERLPCVWSIRVSVSIPSGGGPAQKAIRESRLIQTEQGFQFLPPAPLEQKSGAPGSAGGQGGLSQRGADPILYYRPELRLRAKAEVPEGRSSNLPALVMAIERLRGLAAAHPGHSRAGEPPMGEPSTVFMPSDEELLLSLAGDRIWRSLQLAPPGTVAGVRRNNPAWSGTPVEYPHIEIVQANVAGSGPHAYALPPVSHRLTFE